MNIRNFLFLIVYFPIVVWGQQSSRFLTVYDGTRVTVKQPKELVNYKAVSSPRNEYVVNHQEQLMNLLTDKYESSFAQMALMGTDILKSVEIRFHFNDQLNVDKFEISFPTKHINDFALYEESLYSLGMSLMNIDLSPYITCFMPETFKGGEFSIRINYLQKLSTK